MACLLHTNELPLRQLLQHLDGETTLPKWYCWEIGKKLKYCESYQDTLERGKTLPDAALDEWCIYEMCIGISNGNISLSLSQKDSGKMSHLRWLTAESRILRFCFNQKPIGEV